MIEPTVHYSDRVEYKATISELERTWSDTGVGSRSALRHVLRKRKRQIKHERKFHASAQPSS